MKLVSAMEQGEAVRVKNGIERVPARPRCSIRKVLHDAVFLCCMVCFGWVESGYCQYSQVVGMHLVAQDATQQYLGYITQSQSDSGSIINDLGVYGSPFSSTSIRNPLSQYGNGDSQYSAYCTNAAFPPVICSYIAGQGFVSSGIYLTKNVLITPRVDPEGLIDYLRGTGGGSAVTVMFDAQEGTLPVPTWKTVTLGAAYGTLATTTRSGYTFGGWYTIMNGLGSEVSSSTTVTMSWDHTLYAKWIPLAYTVTFDAQGGTVPTPPSVKVTQGATYGTLATTTRNGYTFGGWYTAENGLGTEVNFWTTMTVGRDHTLYAKWVADAYTVSFDPQDGTVPIPASKTVLRGTPYGTLATTTRSGYTFGGWYTLMSGQGSEVIASTLVTTGWDHTLYAKWIPFAYTVTFDAQGGTEPVPTAQSVTQGTFYGTLATTTRSGYTFGGWYTGMNGKGSEVNAWTTVTAGRDHTLYAKWTADSYTVTFDSQGGTEPIPASKTVTQGSAYGTLATTTREGYIFAGWFTGEVGGGEQVSASTMVTAVFDHTLYAKWTTVPLADNQVARVGVAFELKLSVPDIGTVKVTAKGLPPGLKYNDSTKLIAGVPTKVGTFPVTLAVAGVTTTFTITVEALPEWAWGTFNGYVEGNGIASMTVTAVGYLSGKIALSGTNYTFSAMSYASGGSAQTGFVVKATAKAGKMALSMTLRVTQSAARATLGVASGMLGEAWPVCLFRDVWKNETALLRPLVGYYTATQPGKVEYGSGYLTFTVDKAGKIKAAGKLADGTAMSQSGTLILDTNGCVSAVVYMAPAAYKGGCLFGHAQFVNPNIGDIYLRPLDGVPIRWVSRSPQATAVVGKGFSRELGLIGGWYGNTGNLYDYYRNTRLSVGTDTNAPVPEIIVGSSREPSDLWCPDGIALTVVTNRLGVMTGIAAPKPGVPVKNADGTYDYAAVETSLLEMKFTLTRATGLFKGSFKAWFDYGTTHTFKSIAFEGALTPVREDPADGIAGCGFFLWPDKSLLPAYPFKWSYDFKILLSSEVP